MNPHPPVDLAAGITASGRVTQVNELNKRCFLLAGRFSYDKTIGCARTASKVLFGRGWGDAYGYHMVATGRAEIMLDPIINIWDVAPFPPILREAGGFLGSWAGEEGHMHGEAIACNAALKSKFLALIRDE
jgi:myo-inositol-1(or 4)-monophosphatase